MPLPSNAAVLRLAYDALSGSELPYWQNTALAQFIFRALTAAVLEQESLDDDA